jgi:hypothetical protein
MTDAARSMSILLAIGSLALGACSVGDDPSLTRAAHGGEAPPTLDAGAPVPPAPECTLTQGFWKNHPDAWPVTELTIAGVTYGQAELLALFDRPPRGDASLILAHQLFAALLNGGTGDPVIAATIDAAMAWMAANADDDGLLPFGVRGGTPAHTTATRLATLLAAYDEGVIGPGHCED